MARDRWFTKISMFGIAGVVLLFLGAGAGNGTTGRLTTPFAGPSNCGSCGWCVAGHTAQIREGGDIASTHSWCMELPGCDGHPACSGSASMDGTTEVSPQYEQDLFKVLDGDGEGIVDFARNYPGRVRLNSDRHAAQIVGCQEGVVAAHVPVNSAQFALLQSTLQPVQVGMK